MSTEWTSTDIIPALHPLYLFLDCHKYAYLPQLPSVSE